MRHNLNQEVRFKYKDKIYFGKIINEIGTFYKEFEIISQTEEGDIFSCWVKADQIVEDRRSFLKDRRKGFREI